MKIGKRVLSVLLAAVLMVGMAAAGEVRANAASVADVTAWFDQVVNARQSVGNGQCVGLINGYLTRFWGVTTAGHGINSAYQMWTTNGLDFLKDLGFQKIPRTSGFEVRTGDILVWSGGTDGHTGIATSTSTGTFNTVEQNVSGNQFPTRHTGTTSNSQLYGVWRPPLAPPAGTPRGNLDVLEAGNGTIKIRGWAYDPDNTSAALGIHVYADGNFVAGFTANKSRPDVNTEFPGAGNNHGFDEEYAINLRGTHTIAVYAINAPGTPGSNPLLGQKALNISPNAPIGTLDVASGGAGTIRVKGWTYDPDIPSQSIVVHVYAGGPSGQGGQHIATITANKERKDVNTVFPGAGNYHGFDETFTTTRRGQQSIYVYAINVGAGSQNPLLEYSPRTVTISPTSYTVAYNANATGVTNLPANQTKTEGVALTLSSTRPTRSGYTFIGWATSASTITAQYQPGASYTDNANLNLYAVWQQNTPNTYTVTYNANGGSVSPTSATVNVGSSVTTPTPTKSYTLTYNVNGGNAVSPASKNVSCTVNGWYTAASGGTKRANAGASYTPAQTETLYAQWTNPTMGTLPTPTHPTSGYTFKGWFTAASGGTQVTSSTTMTGNQTIYAQWNTPAHTHNYTSQVTTQPTCTAAGVTTYTCVSGDHTYTQGIPAALGHDFSVKQNTVAPTYDAQGYTVYKCSRCTVTENRDFTSKLVPPPTVPRIFSTKYEANFMNWILFFVCFGWLWMWF